MTSKNVASGKKSGGALRPVTASVEPVVLSPDALLVESDREFIGIVGPDKIGKSNSVISFARYLETLEAPVGPYHPDATFYILDTENGIPPVYRAWAKKGFAPRNVRYYPVPTMDALLLAFIAIRKVLRPWDWIAVESMSRIWELSQDFGYLEVTGVGKSAYLEKLRAESGGRIGKGVSPIPNPDHFWNLVKGAHDRDLVRVLTEFRDVNVLMTAGTEKVRQQPRRENQDRKDFRTEHGIDLNVLGAPQLPYYPNTLIILHRQPKGVFATVLGDREVWGEGEGKRTEFRVPDPSAMAFEFTRICRGIGVEEEAAEEAPAEEAVATPEEGTTEMPW
ncbi:MAG: hypothetical protein Q8R28_02170 [Dehalococcoidia bacterium]|nr:hypothetical protein [Dehalococcoidia bacterium]